MIERLRNPAVLLHRWIGICLSLFFAMWFFSGIVMMYVPFPSLADADRLELLEQIDTRSIAVSPGEAIEVCGAGTVDRLRIITITQRPVYVCHTIEGRIQTVFADDPGSATPLSKRQALLLASSVVPEQVLLGDPVEYDQWIVHQKFDPYRPFFKIEVEDGFGTHLYLSSQTGEFLQRTTSHARRWNYLGAVVHWIYPTVLRKHWAWWDQTVWWLSLFGIFGAALGLYLGVLHLVKVRRARSALMSPFRGWMRWHHLLGLCSGLFVLSWVFSGWLSMDHGRLFSTPEATAEHTRLVRGRPMDEFGAETSVPELRTYEHVKELSFHVFDGAELVVARNENGYVNTPKMKPEDIARVIDASWPNASILSHSIVPERDTYTVLREGQLPEGTVRIELDDANSTWVHINPYTGEINSIMDRSRRIYRWLFNGLHSLDIPGLVERRPLWDVVMLILLIMGLMGSLTGVVVGFKRLIRQFGRAASIR